MTGSGGVGIRGLTDPYTGAAACSRVFVGDHTFRWVRGDRYIAVMRGICLDGRRVLILRDLFVRQPVFEDPQPLVDAIPTPGGDWSDGWLLRELAEAWVARRATAARR